MKTYNALQFINFVQEDCLLHGVQLILHPSDKIELAENFNVSGYWSEEDRTLNVATHHDEWLTTLAHEYGHFCQWKDGKFSDQKTFNAYVNYDEWIVGEKELSKEELKAIENNLIDFYSQQTGIDNQVIQSLMQEDKFISSDAALELKFATEILSPIKAS